MADSQRTTTSNRKEQLERATPSFENVFEERDNRLRDEIAAFNLKARYPTTHATTTPATGGDQGDR
jgi:hypothetical protein